MSTRKLRENTDFEWRRCMRLYLHEQGLNSGDIVIIILLLKLTLVIAKMCRDVTKETLCRKNQN